MSLRLIPPGEIDAILLVVGPGLVGEREDMLLVFTPGLEVRFGSAWDGLASIAEASTPSDTYFLGGTTWVRWIIH
jgi:hypothetical protein